MEDVEALRCQLSAGKDKCKARKNELEGLLDGFAQELDALLMQKSTLPVNIASLERDADHDKKVAEMEWPHLMLFLKNQLTELNEQLVLVARRDEALLCSLPNAVSALDGYFDQRDELNQKVQAEIAAERQECFLK